MVRILMGTDNPTGYKLEDLLAQLQDEINDKSKKIASDTREPAKKVLRNNQQIVGLLMQAEALQRSSYDILDAISPNQGPNGTPRIGEGSWIEWDGVGKPPIEYGEEFSAKLRSGKIVDRIVSVNYIWKQIGDYDDIVEYRPLGGGSV